MYRNTKQAVLAQNTAPVAMVFASVQGGPLSQLVNGMSHPPKNSVAIRAEAVSMLAYSAIDRKSTRLNSSHGYISYAVFCLKKKKKNHHKDVDSTHEEPLHQAVV